MPVKLLATSPFAEPTRMEYEASSLPTTRTYRWKRPLGVLPQYLRPTAAAGTTPRTHGQSARSHGPGTKSGDARQLFSMTQAATEQLRAATQLGHREETKSCDLDAYRIGAPSYGVNNSTNSLPSHRDRTTSKTQLPNIKPDGEGSRTGFEHRVGRQTYSRTEVLLRLQRRKRAFQAKHGPSESAVDHTTGSQHGSRDLPVISSSTKEPGPCPACSSGDARYNASSVAAAQTNRSDSGCYSKDSSSSVKSQKSPNNGRRISVSNIPAMSKAPPSADPGLSDASNLGAAYVRGESDKPNEEHYPRGAAGDQSKRKLGFVGVITTPLYKNDRDSSPDTTEEEGTTGTSSPVVSNDVDSVCEELQKIVLRRDKVDSTCATPFGVRWRDDVGDSPDSGESDKDRLHRAMRTLQPRVPHVVWPENKFFSPNTIFVYASPSRLAPVVIPSHSVDCPHCKFYQASPNGDVCPPNSPTPWMQKEFGFYPVERHFGSK